PSRNRRSSPSDDASRRSPHSPLGGRAAWAVILAEESAPALKDWSGGAGCGIGCSRFLSAVSTPSAAENHTDSSPYPSCRHLPGSTFSGQEYVSPGGFGNL